MDCFAVGTVQIVQSRTRGAVAHAAPASVQACKLQFGSARESAPLHRASRSTIRFCRGAWSSRPAAARGYRPIRCDASAEVNWEEIKRQNEQILEENRAVFEAVQKTAAETREMLETNESVVLGSRAPPRWGPLAGRADFAGVGRILVEENKRLLEEIEEKNAEKRALLAQIKEKAAENATLVAENQRVLAEYEELTSENKKTLASNQELVDKMMAKVDDTDLRILSLMAEMRREGEGGEGPRPAPAADADADADATKQ
eukprot:tig00000350_g24353.t1